MWLELTGTRHGVTGEQLSHHPGLVSHGKSGSLWEFFSSVILRVVSRMTWVYVLKNDSDFVWRTNGDQK